MKTPVLTVIALIAAVVIILSGCQRPTSSSANALHSRQAAQAERIVASCVSRYPGSIRKIENCVTPGRASARYRFETCASGALLNLGPQVIHGALKVRFEQALDRCVLESR